MNRRHILSAALVCAIVLAGVAETTRSDDVIAPVDRIDRGYGILLSDQNMGGPVEIHLVRCFPTSTLGLEVRPVCIDQGDLSHREPVVFGEPGGGKQ